MKALVFHKFGGPDVLEIADVPSPVVGPGQALVRIRNAGLNFADIYRRKGNYHLVGAPPWILGYEGAGVVETAPAGAREIQPGMRVGFADSPFANAELAAVDVDRLIPLPDTIDFDLAAAVLLQGLTAQYLVRDSYRPRRGDWAVVHAAAGGVGLLLTQLLKREGARVIAIASTDEKRQAVKDAGADDAIDSANWAVSVGQLTKSGADVVYDSVGSTLADSLAAARIGGTVVFYGMADGDPAPVDPRLLMDRSLTLVGGDLWNVLTGPDIRRARAGELFDLVADGTLKVRIAARFRVEQGADAHRLLEGRKAIGKIVLEI